MKQQTEHSAGFTLVEVLLVVAIIGILANIAVPAVQKALWRARAISVIRDFHIFEKAFYEYERDHQKLPPNGTAKIRPHELDPYLGPNYNWLNPHPWIRYYVWENWTDKAHGQRLNIQYGFSLKQPDERIVRAIREVYDGRFEATVFSKYTFVISAFRKE